jgi:wobble nucleotide-excising tRNase
MEEEIKELKEEIKELKEEIKRLRRLNMKMYFTMSNIIQILNKRETDELLKLSMSSIDKDMIYTHTKGE